ncbi:Testis [Pristimantis euphronides]
MDRSVMYQLAGVKHTLYHPRLPTLRRMEMDSMAHKLSDEHSRSSTPCDHRNFRSGKYNPEMQLLPSLEIPDTGRRLTQRRADWNTTAEALGWSSKEETTSMTAAKDYSTCTAASGDFQLKDLKRMNLGFSGYAVRFLSPKVTHSWKFCLEHFPSLDEHGQKPVPVETMNFFRTFGRVYR